MAIDAAFDVVIGRPPAEVFAHLVAVERWPEWLIASGITQVERATPGDGPLVKGTGLRIHQRLAGVRSTIIEATVTGIAAPDRFVLAGRDADGISVEIEAAITATETGSTLRWRLKVGLPFRFRFFESMALPQLRRAAALDLEAFKRRLESVAEG